MKRMRTLEESMVELMSEFKEVNVSIINMDPNKKVKFTNELNKVENEWLKQAVAEGLLNHQQAVQMTVYPNPDIQLSVMDQLNEYQLKRLFRIAYELIMSEFLEVKESRDLFEICLDTYVGVYF